MTEKLPTPYTHAIGQVLHRQREQNGRRLGDVAERLGISRPRLASIEQGTEPLSVELFDDICTVLSVLPAAVMLATRRALQADLTQPIDATRPLNPVDDQGQTS